MSAAARTAPAAETCRYCGGTDHPSITHDRVGLAIAMAQRELAEGHVTRAGLWLGVAARLAIAAEEQSR